MDKNKIYVDDLIRNRMSGAEEGERPGSWHAMRALLDEKMPDKTAAPFNWRKMLGATAAIFIAASLSVGGYHYMEHRKAEKAIYASNTAATTHTPVATTPAHLNPATASIPITAPVTAQPTSATTAHGPKNNKVKPTTPAIVKANTSGSKARVPTTGNAIAVASNNKTTAVHKTVKTSEAKAVQTTGTIAQQPSGSTASIATNTISVATTPKTQQTTVAANHKPADKITANTIASNHTVADKAPVKKQIIPASGTTVASHKTITTRFVPVAFGLKKDTIEQIQVVHHRVIDPITGTAHFRKDTIAMSKEVLDRLKPIIVSTTEAVAANTHTPTALKENPSKPANEAVAQGPKPAMATPAAPVPNAAANTVAANADNNLVSLSQFRVASKLRNLWNTEHFNAIINQAKFNLARAQFYAGMTGGINASVFSVNALAGFQLGLTGLVVFNEHWSVGGELKFYQKFNVGNSIKDDYTTRSNFIPGNSSIVNGVTYRQYTWTQDSVDHYYNFTSVQTIELPVSLRYNVGRFFGEAGVNLLYAFSVNPEEIDHPHGNSGSVSMTLPGTVTNESLGGGKPMINIQDFHSRFGMGYVLGAGYQFTPAVQMNLRLVQSVWDNASSEGAQRVSRNLYKTPSVQLSVGYRFSQQKGK